MSHASGMADKEEENNSRRLNYGVDAQQQQEPLTDTDEMSKKNNSGEIEYIKSDDRKIFIGGLKKETTENDLSLHFIQFGEIQHINVKLDITTGWCRGFAFIVFKKKEGLDNALACTNHVINGKKVDPKKAVPRQVKLFVGGLSPDLTDDDIKDYFERYTTLVAYEMPYNRMSNERKSFCFLIFDSILDATEILKSQTHVIKGIPVYVRKTKHFRNNSMMNTLRPPMSGMRLNFCGQGGRRGFPPQSLYAPGTPGYFFRGYYYNNQFVGYSPDYTYTYGYPYYGAGARANYQYRGYKSSTSRGGHEKRILE